MAFVNETRTSGLAIEISAGVHSLVQRVVDYRAYRVTIRELNALSDRALADLGLHRSGIKAAAIKVVYGE